MHIVPFLISCYNWCLHFYWLFFLCSDEISAVSKERCVH